MMRMGNNKHISLILPLLVLISANEVVAAEMTIVAPASQPAVAGTLSSPAPVPKLSPAPLPIIAPTSQPQAAPALAPPVTEGGAPAAADQSPLESIDEPRNYLSNKIVEFGKSVDQFFGDPRYFQENNKSVVQVEFNQTFDEGGNYQNRLEGKAKFDLPASQKRFRLVIESNPSQNTAGEIRKDVTPLSKQPTTNKPEQYAASLRYEQPEHDRVNFSSELGAQFQFPLDPFARSRASYSIPFEDWHFKVAETVFWFSSIGLGETTQIDMEHQLGPPVLFRATSTATCYESPQNCDLRQDLTIYHTLSDRAAIQHQISVLGVSEPKLTETNYVIQSKYRYRLHKDWVFYEINPQISFPKTDAFHLNSLLFLKLEMLFGATR